MSTELDALQPKRHRPASMAVLGRTVMAITIVAVFALVPHVANAAVYYPIGFTKTTMSFVEISSIDRKKANPTIWSLVVLKDREPISDTEFGFAIRAQEEVDCGKRTTRTLYTQWLGADGVQLRSIKQDLPAVSHSPGTAGARLIAIACGEFSPPAQDVREKDLRDLIPLMRQYILDRSQD